MHRPVATAMLTRLSLQVPLTISENIASKLSLIGQKAAARTHQGERCDASWPTLAAFQVLLGRYSRQEDITIGVPATASGKEVQTSPLFKAYSNLLSPTL